MQQCVRVCYGKIKIIIDIFFNLLKSDCYNPLVKYDYAVGNLCSLHVIQMLD